MRRSKGLPAGTFQDQNRNFKSSTYCDYNCELYSLQRSSSRSFIARGPRGLALRSSRRRRGSSALTTFMGHPFEGVEQHQAIKEPALAEIFAETNRAIVEKRLLAEGGKR